MVVNFCFVYFSGINANRMKRDRKKISFVFWFILVPNEEDVPRKNMLFSLKQKTKTISFICKRTIYLHTLFHSRILFSRKLMNISYVQHQIIHCQPFDENEKKKLYSRTFHWLAARSDDEIKKCETNEKWFEIKEQENRNNNICACLYRQAAIRKGFAYQDAKSHLNRNRKEMLERERGEVKDKKKMTTASSTQCL